METVYFASGGKPLPTGGSGASVISGVEINVYGSYALFATSTAQDIYIYGLSEIYNPTDTTYCHYDIAIGAGGAEVVKHTTVMTSIVIYTTYLSLHGYIPIPNLYIPAGSRVTVRAADSHTIAKTHKIYLHYLEVANIVNSVLSEVQSPDGIVVDNVGNTSSTFLTNLTSAVNDYWKDAYLKFKTGSLTGQVKKVVGYTGATKFITCEAFTDEPTADDSFDLINR